MAPTKEVPTVRLGPKTYLKAMAECKRTSIPIREEDLLYIEKFIQWSLCKTDTFYPVEPYEFEVDNCMEPDIEGGVCHHCKNGCTRQTAKIIRPSEPIDRNHIPQITDSDAQDMRNKFREMNAEIERLKKSSEPKANPSKELYDVTRKEFEELKERIEKLEHGKN